MENNTETKPMPKWLIYNLFILKFILGLGLIYWTIYMTLQSDVGKDEDNAFLSSYHDVDRNFNDIVKANQNFELKYNVKFDFNNQTLVGLSYSDIFLAQRAIQERKIRKHILKVGENSFTVLVQDKSGNIVKNKIVDMLITKSTNHTEDVKLLFTNVDNKKFNIESIGYWNITGTILIGNDKGTFYIKTNAKDYD